MKRQGLRLNPRLRFLFYTAGSIMLLTGVAWRWIHWLDENGAVGPSLRKIKPLLLQMHGLGAMVFVLLLGIILPTHVKRAWHTRRNRVNGAIFLTAVGTLTLSGYILYYLGNETWRAWTSQLHFWLGAAVPLLLFWHIAAGRKSRPPRH